MIYLWDEIDRLKRPDVLTREIAKLQAPPNDMPEFPWEVNEMSNGAIQFRRLTPVSEYLITVRVKRRRKKG